MHSETRAGLSKLKNSVVEKNSAMGSFKQFAKLAIQNESDRASPVEMGDSNIDKSDSRLIKKD